MDKQSKTILQRMIPGLLLGFLVFIGLMLLADVRTVAKSLSNFRWVFFLAAIGFTLLNYFLRFLKWQFYLRQIGIRSLPWKESLRLFVGGFPLAVTPGKVGEVLKGIWLRQLCGIPVGRGVSVVAAERISDGVAVLLLSTLGVIAYPRYWPAFLAVLLLMAFFIALTQLPVLAERLFSLLEHIRFLKRIIPEVREFYEGSAGLFRPLPLIVAVGLGMVSWLGEGIGFYLILVGLGLEPGMSLASTAVFVLAFSTVIGAVSTLPGGLGAAEASIAGMLTLIMGFAPATASSATILIRLATLWFGVLLGLIVWSFSRHLLGFTLAAREAADGGE